MAAADLPAPRTPPETPPSLLVHRVVRTYLNEKAKEKSGVDPEKFKDGDRINWEKVPPAFGEARRKLAEGIFLEFRSRHDQAFADHFVATFCSAKQYLSERDFCVVADHLLQRTEDVKTLTLLALSANS
jgi:CRISPR-associated protein Cmx8